jgi:putative tryptophan/tyrosine transport system substrate-binding protein
MAITIGRREFVTLLGGAAAAWPRAARAQQVRRIGVVMPYTQDDPEDQARVAALQDGLRQAGWIEGRNLRSEYHWYAGETERARAIAMELVEQRPELIVVGTTIGSVALKQETRTIPLVFVGVTDPVGQGLVDTLARPGGNATGLTYFEFSVVTKLLETLKQIAPGITRVTMLYSAEGSVATPFLQSIGPAGRSFEVELIAAPIRDTAEIETAVAALALEPGGGLMCLPDIYLNVHRRLIVELAARHKLPAAYTFRFFAAEGGLFSYGIEVTDLYRRAGAYVDRILKGEKPADLPVQQPTKFELVINMKTAKALGLEIPPRVLALANEVIE